MARRSRCWTAHLVLALAVLVVTARCSAGQQPQYSGGAPNLLRAIISSAVADAAHPIAAELGSLRTLLDGIASRLQVQDARLDALNARLDSIGGLNSRLDSLKDGQDVLNTRQDTMNTSLVASLAALNTRLDDLNTSLDALNTGQDAMNASHNSSLAALNTRLDALNTGQDALRVGQDGLNSRLDSLKGGQDVLNTRVTSSVMAALEIPPRDCSDLIGAGTGVYTIRPGGNGGDTTSAFCDMDTDGGGWTVFQRRADLLPRQNFFLEWAEYRAGFGNMTGEFWWGLEKLHLMTSALDRRYELRVDLGDWDGERRHALYQDFRISPETDGYRLTGGNYSGDAGDSLGSYHLGCLVV